MSEASENADRFIDFARRPGSLLLIIVLWPSTLVTALGGWAVYHNHQLALQLLEQCK